MYGKSRTSHLISRDFRGTPFRTFSVIVALAVIVSLVFSTIVLAIGVQRSAELESQRLGADVVVLPATVEKVQSYGPAYDTLNVAFASNKYIDSSVERTIANITGISSISAQLYVGSLNNSGLRLVAFEPETDFTVLPWLDNRPQSVGSTDAIVGSKTGLTAGQVLHLGGSALNVIGVLEKTNTSMDQTVFFPLQTAYRLLQQGAGVSQFGFREGQISIVLAKLKPDYSPEILARDIGLRIPDFRVTVALGIESRASLEIGGVPVYQLLVESVVGTALVILVGFLFSMTVNERRRQLGLLRSLGATRRYIFLVVLIEACFVALVGSIVGLGVGTAIIYLGQGSIVHVFKIGYLQPPFAEVVQIMAPSLLLGVGMGAVAAIYPARIASLLDPYEAIRQGE